MKPSHFAFLQPAFTALPAPGPEDAFEREFRQVDAIRA
jgi:hypothetical protein